MSSHPLQKKCWDGVVVCPQPLEPDGGFELLSTVRGCKEQVSRGLELDVDGGLAGDPQVLLEVGTKIKGAGPPKIKHPPPPKKLTQRTLMLRRNLAENCDIRMFSGRENCCRIPPADRTVEAWEYWRPPPQIKTLIKESVLKVMSPQGSGGGGGVSPWGPAPPAAPSCHAAGPPTPSAKMRRPSPGYPPRPPPRQLLQGGGDAAVGSPGGSNPPPHLVMVGIGISGSGPSGPGSGQGLGRER